MNESDDVTTKMLDGPNYPSPSQDDFQLKIYEKRDFYIHNIPMRKKFESYEEIKEYRDDKCGRAFKPSTHQALLSNFINPQTPYKGCLIFHGTGSGKSGAAVLIGESFKPMVEKYGNKIHVLVPGPFNKQGFITEILKTTGNKYYSMFHNDTTVITDKDKERLRKQAISALNQYYKIMSHRSFHKKVLGEKVIDKDQTTKKKKVYRKDEEGKLERDHSIDRIYSLDNSLLIVDEAHSVTGNEYGESIKKIIESSKNLKVLFLTATPMKNFADDFIPLINMLRPPSMQIEREKIFTSNRDHTMRFKPNGKDYMRKMCRGYVSYLKGTDPLTFAERNDIGDVPPGLSFTKVTKCNMLDFQLDIYSNVIKTHDDTLDKRSGAVANFVFPGLTKDKKDITGYHGIDGINELKSQLKINPGLLTKKISETILKKYNITNHESLVYLTDNGKNISGDIFDEKYLIHFSTKFHTILKNINDVVAGKKGPGLVFLYSNLVRVGIELFTEVLIKNGYLEFQENSSSYVIKSNTRCYYCGNGFGDHQGKTNDHDFHPATFISFTGKSDESVESVPEEKERILGKYFNPTINKDGKIIKLILGSKVMSEGITLNNIKEIHIMDVHYNLGRVDQVMGRGIRFCRHYKIMNEENPFPKVDVYKYVIALENDLSSEEKLYKKAEQKYLLVKEAERILQEEAIDCPLNRNGNIFPEELEKYAGCGDSKNPCPAACGFLSCDYKCGDKLLNAKYYDPERNVYKKVEKYDLDYSTYNNTLASEEIQSAKEKIKELYRIDNIYILDDILQYIKSSYPEDKMDLFDEYYVFQALDDMIPLSTNDFNTFSDVIIDKFNRPGYIIYRNKYYIFQPFDQNEDLPMHYRRHNIINVNSKLSLKDYIKNDPNNSDVLKNLKKHKAYDFESTQEYYDSRDEYDFVGIIDKSNNAEDEDDDFKIRKRRPKVLSKKRETGIPSFKGAVCKISKEKGFLNSITGKIGVKDKKHNRTDMCQTIMKRLYDMEKYSTSKDGNKLTYLIVPMNHPTIPFPLNLEDRITHILNKIKDETRQIFTHKIISTKTTGDFNDIKYIKYEIKLDNSIDKFEDVLKKYGGIKQDGQWTITIA